MRKYIDSRSDTLSYCLQRTNNHSNLGRQISPKFCWLEAFNLRMLLFAFAVVIWDYEILVQKVLFQLMVAPVNEKI